MSPATFVLDTPEKRERCAKRINALPLEGEVWDVTVKPWEPIRSVKANNRLHLIFYRVAKKIGDDIESVKLAYKKKFLPGKKSLLDPTLTVYPKTSKMSPKQLNEFMEQVEVDAITEHGIMLGENEYSY